MIISVFNKKGGVGKTSLAFNIAKDLGYFLLSNDDSNIEQIYKNKAKIIQKIKVHQGDVIYDLGGFLDKDLHELFKLSDIILIPTTLDINSIVRTINTVKEIQAFTQNKIIIIINRINAKNIHKFKESIDAIKALKVEIYGFRESEIINNSIHTGKTILELATVSNLARNTYKNILHDYEIILKRLKNGI